jgi:hypothetical protein
MNTEPLLPSDALPVPRYTAPLVPTLELPVLNERRPLTPDRPASAVCITIDPLVAAEL